MGAETNDDSLMLRDLLIKVRKCRSMNSIGSMHVCMSKRHLCNLYVTCLDELFQYSRSDLLKLRFHQDCTKRLAGLESNKSLTDIVLDKVRQHYLEYNFVGQVNES